MSRHILLVAAAAIFWAHMAVVAFNVAGLVVIPLGAWRKWRFVRNFWLRALHLAALVVVALQAVAGDACFLTLWQSELLARAGEAASYEPLLQRWVEAIVFWPYTLLLWRIVPPDTPLRRERRGAPPRVPAPGASAREWREPR
jgi:hypothetical protein